MEDYHYEPKHDEKKTITVKGATPPKEGFVAGIESRASFSKKQESYGGELSEQLQRSSSQQYGKKITAIHHLVMGSFLGFPELYSLKMRLKGRP